MYVLTILLVYYVAVIFLCLFLYLFVYLCFDEVNGSHI
jgi:hypothetical protein